METVAANIWQKSKLLVKGLLIGGLILLLLIPSYFVQEIVREREARQKEAFTEISGKWAGRQDITGPGRYHDDVPPALLLIQFLNCRVVHKPAF